MSDIVIGLLSFPALLGLIFLRVPIGLAMFLVGLVGLILVTGDTTLPFARLKSETFGTFSNYSLSIVPMFLLMGHFATLGGMSQALFKAAEAWLGHRKGGVAMAAVGACAGFGAICGSSLATAATMSRVALPELRKYGYSGGFSTATLAAGGTLGILIPPSVVLVIYAILTEQNIAKLFLAAFIPGILAALGYMAAISLYVRLNPGTAGARPRVAYSERLRALARIWPMLVVFFLVVGGIYLGWFTPTEMAEGEFQALKILGTWVHGPGMFHTADPVETPDDLKGMKIRGGSRLVNKLLDLTGATPVGMPVPAVPEALSKGVIDGTTIPWEVTGALKVPELVENHTEFEGPALYTLTFVLAMNKDKFEALPADLQAVVDANSGMAFSVFAGGTQEAADGPARDAAIENGNTIVTVTDTSAWQQAVQPIYADWVAEMNDKGIDGQARIDQARALMAGSCKDARANY